jgi:hypothetical protein
VDVVKGAGGTLSYGAGANAPSWPGKTVYTAEDFSTDLPVSPSSANSAGFLGRQGFAAISGYFLNASYPEVSTPFGTQRVLRITFPGQTETIAALDGATTAWPFRGTEYRNAAARITGTWSGALAFEKSTDGGNSWSSMTVTRVSDSASVSSTTANGTFQADTGSTVEFFRVRASAWTSGTATISVGMAGGQAPARMTAGTFNASQSKIYTRIVCRVSANFDNNGNVGTKFFFFRQADGDNHYVAGVSSDNVLAPSIALQPARTSVGTASLTGALDTWHDMEFIAEANTPGTGNGVGRTYLNGSLSAERTDFSFFDTGDTAVFSQLFFDPTFGGGTNPPPANLHLDIAYWYRESA